MLNLPQARRFPPPCRFYSKGTCRAGDQCLFAHILQAVSKQTKHTELPISDLHDQTVANRDHRAGGGNSRRRSTDLHSVEVQKAIQKSQIAQLERRYASSFAMIMNGQSKTIVQIAVKPPHDFSFDLSSLVIQISVPNNYPRSAATVKVQNCDIPKGFAINLERGYNEHMGSHQPETRPSLVNQISWLEKHMEILLSLPPAPTMRFVKNKVNPTAAAATVEVERLVEIDTPSNAKVQQQKPRIIYSHSQLEKAKVTRERHLKQLETRFPDSYRLLRSDNQGTVIYLCIKLSDPTFGFRDIFGDAMDICITVPTVYPLEPCQMEIMSDGLEDWRLMSIAQGFQTHVVDNPSSLFQHLNWLVRNLDDLMKKPRSREIFRPTAMEQEQPAVPRTVPKPKSLLTSDDVVHKPKKIFVSDPSQLLPPAHQAQLEQQKHDESHKPVHVESSPSSSDSEPTAFSPRTGNSRARGGIEIRHPDISLENIALLQLSSLNMTVKCNRCRNKFSIMDLAVEVLDKSHHEPAMADISIGERWLACPKCTQIVGIRVFPDYIHENSSTLCLVQTAKCTPTEILPSRYLAICARCDSNCQNSITVASFGQKVTVACRACHTALSLGVQKCSMVRIGGLASDWLQADEQEVLKLQRRSLQEKSHNRTSLGQALPSTGTCRHFRKSHRWMRFECCMRAYPCDKCHDEAEDHIYEMAQKMICGFCSKEQPYHQQRCIGCDKLLTGAYHHGIGSKKPELYKNRAHDLVKAKAGSQPTSKKEHRAELQ